jgi:hypothetical protein
VATVAYQTPRANGQGGDQVEPLLLAQLRARHCRACNGGLTERELGHEARRAQAQHGLLQHDGAPGGRDGVAQFAEAEVGRIDRLAARPAGQGPQQVEQLAVLRTRDRFAAGRVAQHGGEAIVEMHRWLCALCCGPVVQSASYHVATGP